MTSHNIIAIFRSLLVGVAFITWGVIVGMAWGAEWGTAQAGKITFVFGALGFIYGTAEYRSAKRRGKGQGKQ